MQVAESSAGMRRPIAQAELAKVARQEEVSITEWSSSHDLQDLTKDAAGSVLRDKVVQCCGCIP
jgi:hypothetical protein